MLALAFENPAIPPAPAVTQPPSRTILALDLGTRTGWAVLPRSGRIASGVTEFRPGRFEGAGMAFLRFEKFLADLNRDAGPFDAVVFEEVRAHAGTLAAQVYGGFLAHLTAWCERNRVPYLGVPVATIKRHATGKGNASKDEVIAAMLKRGFQPGDDNEADALALLSWAIEQKIGGTQ
jgi:Holliday junction resolvasome RuvABC endonuclease subunit